MGQERQDMRRCSYLWSTVVSFGWAISLSGFRDVCMLGGRRTTRGVRSTWTKGKARKSGLVRRWMEVVRLDVNGGVFGRETYVRKS